MPSAKIHSINEAVLLLQHLPNYEDAKTIIFLPKDIKTYKSGKQVALADYYFGRFAHVLGRVKIIEIDKEKKNTRDLSDTQQI